MLQPCNSDNNDIVCGDLSTPVVVGEAALLSYTLSSGLPAVHYVRSIVHVNVTHAYITDSTNNRILRFDPASNTVSSFSGTDVANWQDGDHALYNRPTHMFLHPAKDSLVVLDANNYVVRRVFISNGSATTIAGTPRVQGVGQNQIGIAQDMIYSQDDGVVYMADNYDLSIRSLNLTTGVITKWCGGNGFSTIDGFCDVGGASFQSFRGIDTYVGSEYLYVLAYGYLRVVDKVNMYAYTVDANIKGSPDFWLRFLGGKLCTWSQDASGSQAGKIVELYTDQQTSNVDLLNRPALMKIPPSRVDAYWLPPALSPDGQYFTSMGAGPTLAPLTWRNYLPCNESSIVPGESVLQSCRAVYASKSCRYVQPIQVSTVTTTPTPGINITDPVFANRSNEVWSMKVVSLQDTEYYNMAWFCDARASSLPSSLSFGAIHTMHFEPSSLGKVVVGQREGLWNYDVLSGNVTKHFSLVNPAAAGYPLLTRVIGNNVVTRQQVLHKVTEEPLSGSSVSVGYATGTGVDSRFTSIRRATLANKFPQDSPFAQEHLILDDKTLLQSMWRPVDTSSSYMTGAGVFLFFGKRVQLQSFLVDPYDSTIIYGATRTHVFLFRARDPTYWRVTMGESPLERGVKVLVGEMDPLTYSEVVWTRKEEEVLWWNGGDGMAGQGFRMNNMEEIVFSPDYKFIYITDTRRRMFRHHLASGVTHWLPDFPLTAPDDIVFRGIVPVGGGEGRHRYFSAVHQTCGLAIIERGCNVGMGFTPPPTDNQTTVASEFAYETRCILCSRGKYSPYMDHQCTDFTMVCPVGYYAVGSNTPGTTVQCTPCPYGSACPLPHVANNVTYQFPAPQFVPWVKVCNPGTFGSGQNNNTHVATCPPCPVGYACPGTARSVDTLTSSVFLPILMQVKHDSIPLIE